MVRSVALNLGSIEPQGFGELVSWVRRFGGLLGNMKKKKKHIFPTTKGSINACMELGSVPPTRLRTTGLDYDDNLVLINYVRFSFLGELIYVTVFPFRQPLKLHRRIFIESFIRHIF